MNGLANRVLRSFSLVVTDRRWAAPMSAAALGFGIFAGVAIGPSAAGTVAGAPQLIEIAESGGGEPPAAQEGGEALAAGPGEGFAAGRGSAAPLPPVAPLAPLPPSAPAAAPAPPPAEIPAEEEATELNGIVVQANPAAGSYALAIEGGELVPVHARKLPVPGTRLAVEAEQLANGSFAEAGKREQRDKPATQATFKGTITYTTTDVPVFSSPYGYVRTGTSAAYTVSGRGASLLVRVEPQEDGPPPEVGAFVAVTVAIEPRPGEGEEPGTGEDGEEVAEGEGGESAEGEEVGAQEPEPGCRREEGLPKLPRPEPAALLWERRLEAEDTPPATYLDLAAMVTALCPEQDSLLLSADGDRQSGADLELAVPAEIELGRLELDDSYLATAEVAEDGALQLAGIAGDEQRRGADDEASAQGDLKR